MSAYNYMFILIIVGRALCSEKMCSRQQSKFVREYFARSLLPIYQKYAQPVPDKCPFSPVHDIYHNHENNKTKLDTYKWKCELCGKLFAKESDLDKHFDNRHNNTLQLGRNNICLANYCRIFRCDVLMNLEAKKSKCYESTMNILQNKCKEHIDLCIPKGAPLSVQNKLTIELRESLCSYLTCSKIDEYPNYLKKGPSFFQIFIIVFIIILSIIAYVIINHTDLIFDENEIGSLDEQVRQLNSANSYQNRNMINNVNDKFENTNPATLRHRNINQTNTS